MKFSGFYMGVGKDKENTKDNVIRMYKDELSNTITNLYGKNSFEVTDIIRDLTTEDCEDENSKCYDVHFILNLPEVDGIKEDTEPFYDMEKAMFTGLGVIEE